MPSACNLLRSKQDVQGFGCSEFECLVKAVPAPPHSLPSTALHSLRVGVTHYSLFHILYLLPKASSHRSWVSFRSKALHRDLCQVFASAFCEMIWKDRRSLCLGSAGLRIHSAVVSTHIGQLSINRERKMPAGLTAGRLLRAILNKTTFLATGFPKALGCWAPEGPWCSWMVSRAHLGKVRQERNRLQCDLST